MNQKKVIRQPPSLLIEDYKTPPDDMHTLLPPHEKDLKPGIVAPGFRYFWVSLSVLLVVIALASLNMPESSDGPHITVDPASATTSLDASGKTTNLPTTTSLQQSHTPIMSSARIEDVQPLIQVKPDPEMVVHPQKNLAKAEPPPVSRSIKPHPHVATSAAPKAAAKSDVDVLIALIRYSEDDKSSRILDLQDRLDKCPAPNTQAGIQCRQNICAQPGGEAILCPVSR